MNNDCLDKYPMKSSYFSEEAHRRVFEFILSQRNNNITADSVTLKNFFNTDEILRQIGGSNYLSIMLVVSTGILDYVSYCKLLQDFYIKRQFKELLLNHLKEVENLKLNSDTLLKNCMDEMQQLRESNVNFSFGYEKLEEIDNKLENATDSYVKTGLIDFDKEILGIPRGNLTVLGGRPSMGKSTLALNIACNMAKNGNRICFFSAEMSKAELYVKILSRLTSIDNRRISQNNLSGYEIERIEETKKNLKIPLFIDDRTFVDTDYIKQGILNFRRRNKGIDCVFIDHLHLLKDRHNRPLAKLAFAKICQDIKNF
jgi:replicative DNA helicase